MQVMEQMSRYLQMQHPSTEKVDADSLWPKRERQLPKPKRHSSINRKPLWIFSGWSLQLDFESSLCNGSPLYTKESSSNL